MKQLTVLILTFFSISVSYSQLSTIKKSDLTNLISKTLYVLNREGLDSSRLEQILTENWDICNFEVVDELKFASKMLDTNYVFFELYTEANVSTYPDNGVTGGTCTYFHGYCSYMHFFTGKDEKELPHEQNLVNINRRGIFFPLTGSYLEYLNVYVKMLQSIIKRSTAGESLLKKSDILLRYADNDYVNLRSEKVLVIPQSVVKSKYVSEGLTLAYRYKYKVCNSKEIDEIMKKTDKDKYYILVGGKGGLFTFKYSLDEACTGRIVKYSVVNKFYRFYDYADSPKDKFIRHYQIKSIKLLCRNLLRY